MPLAPPVTIAVFPASLGMRPSVTAIFILAMKRKADVFDMRSGAGRPWREGLGGRAKTCKFRRKWLLPKRKSEMASVLFSPLTMRGLTLPNRVVVSPMCQYNSDNGSANDWHLMHLGNMSLGAAGLVMCEMTDVNPQGRISPKCAGMYSDDNEKALKRVHDFCRQYGVAKLGVQLGHAGRKGPTTPPAAGGKPILEGPDAWTPEAPSAIPYDTGWP